MKLDDFAADCVDLPPLQNGELLLETLWLSMDPAMRGWLDDRASYLPPVALGEPVRALGLARVIRSASPRVAVGQILRGFVGWQERLVTQDSLAWEIIEDSPDFPLQSRLGVLGMTGMTAWVGMKDIARVQPTDTVVVSAAAGAVGSVAAQIAKAAGARVVGVAGGPEKCRLLEETLGLDASVDHRADDWRQQLIDATPEGVDVNFENVGGRVLEAVIDRMNDHGRLVLCGLIDGYNAEQRPPGPSNFGKLLTKRIHLQGFIVFDHFERTAQIEAELTGMLTRGQIKLFDTLTDGFDALPDTFISSFTSQHVGKLLVRIAD